MQQSNGHPETRHRTAGSWAFGVVIHDGPVEILGRMGIEPRGEGGTRLTMAIEIPGSTNPIDPALLERTVRNIKVLIESEVPKAS